MKELKGRKLNMLALILVCLVLLGACKRDYITGGNPHDENQYKNTSTYDVLKSLTGFDTLVQIIDAAGFKDKINQQGTSFFAVSNGSVFNYLTARTLMLQATVDQNKKFLLDSLLYYVQNNIKGTRDSLGMYLIPGKVLAPSNLTLMGEQFSTQLPGNSVLVSYEITRDPNSGYNDKISTMPQLVYFTQLWKPYQLGPDSTAADVPSNTGVHTRVRTSFINTQNGSLFVLAPSSVLFFYGTKQK